MSDLAFPTLKTGALAQHPFRRTLRFSTKVLTFVDGSEQRAAIGGPVLRSWEMPLTQLDESELWEREIAFESSLGGARDVRFVDPIDGAEYDGCHFVEDQIELEIVGEDIGQTEVRISEGRS